ncbi:MAG: heparan-alpha-glucosaminide N-acetyltransferase [Archaeoglobaceae archaeon]
MARYWEVDFARGVAVILMLLFHFYFDSYYFGKIQLEGFFWYLFPRIIGGMFIFISGVTFTFSYKGFRHALRRSAKFGAIALGITAATYLISAEEFVLFGIIHFFCLASLLAVFFAGKKKLSFLLGLSIAIFGFYIQQFRFQVAYFSWLGFIPEGFRTLDYYPIMPWFGVFLLGMTFGYRINLKIKNYRENLVSFLGRHSLIVYLIQHPIIVILLQLYYGDIFGILIEKNF